MDDHFPVLLKLEIKDLLHIISKDMKQSENERNVCLLYVSRL